MILFKSKTENGLGVAQCEIQSHEPNKIKQRKTAMHYYFSIQKHFFEDVQLGMVAYACNPGP